MLFLNVCARLWFFFVCFDCFDCFPTPQLALNLNCVCVSVCMLFNLAGMVVPASRQHHAGRCVMKKGGVSIPPSHS